jgi:Fe-S cluster biosynthesis and repair protein YggX
MTKILINNENETFKITRSKLIPVLECIIHTILFQRGLSHPKFQKQYSEELDIYFVKLIFKKKSSIISQDISEEVTKRLNEIKKKVTENGSQENYEFELKFESYKFEKSYYVFSNIKKEAWETWVLNISIVEEDQYGKNVAEEITTYLKNIITKSQKININSPDFSTLTFDTNSDFFKNVKEFPFKIQLINK